MASPEILKVIKIVQIEDSYFFRFEYEIIVVQKKFGKYLPMDNIYKKDRDCFVQISENTNLIACLVDKILEINEITFGEKKSQANMVDFIDLSEYIEGSTVYERFLQ